MPVPGSALWAASGRASASARSASPTDPRPPDFCGGQAWSIGI